MKVIFRTRLNGRIPDPQDKYRDEITQEATIEYDDPELDNIESLVEDMQSNMVKIRAKFYAELARLGGKGYAKV